MAGALSGHIISSYESTISNQSLCTDGLLSFAPNMHGSQQSFDLGLSHASTSMNESTYERVSRLQAKLNQKLGPEFISQRPGPGGGPKLTYAEGWKVINVANEVFGFDGWSSNIVSLTTITWTSTRKRGDTTSGCRRKACFTKTRREWRWIRCCKKEAVTDGLKRTLRTFGNVLGNCLYDKQYTSEIVKIKVPPIKLDKGELYRLPELSEKPPVAVPVASTSRQVNATSTPQASSNPISSVPRHLQQAKPRTGLQTPITTPSHAPPPRVQAAPPPPQERRWLHDSFGFFSDETHTSRVSTSAKAIWGGRSTLRGHRGALLSAGSGASSRDGEVEEVAKPKAGQRQEERYGPMGLGRTGQMSGQGARYAAPQQQPVAVPRGAMNPPPNPPPQQKPSVASSSTASTSRPSGANAPPSVWGVPQNQNTNQIQKPASAGAAPAARPGDSSASSSGRTCPTTPSAGGFHFPPGMPNPLLQSSSRPPAPLPQGLKRGADAMSGSSMRAGPGMGLSGNSGGGARQPLGTLALDDQNKQQQQYQYQQGGEAKRIKR
ncbi:hypothetical protein B0H10DRAFT_2044633 [Mycena sp. CBHHK59/15]|nr:hypothetical protein B0H10DRAFT_2044633 [Mycena sp. CBHHK59/15]